MPNYIAAPLKSKTGIQRDGTVFDSDNYVDGLWCRFYKGRARKMGGYNALTVGTEELVRNMYSVPIDSAIQLYLGRPSSVGYTAVNFDGNASSLVNRTPVANFIPDPNNQWCFDLAINILDGVPQSFILGHVAPNVLDITSTTNGPIFAGNINNNLPLEAIGDTLQAGTPLILCSGGVIFSAPIVVAYGNNGQIQWSNPNDITAWSNTTVDPPVPNTAIIANTKLIKGYRTRGGTAPALLFWTANSLVRADYVVVASDTGGVATFSAQTLQDDITVLSPNCIVKYNQMFFWIGIDQFYFFNGIVQKLTNTMSSDFFFDNLNYQYRSKVFGFAIPRYKEIWWLYPRLNPDLDPDDPNQPSECTHAVIYNMEEDTWYDTPLARSAGIPSTTFPYPVMAASDTITIPSRSGGTTSYPVWQHEVGRDRVIGSTSYAIQSYFQTHYMTLFANNPENNVLTRLMRVEPDFVMRGEMTVSALGRKFPQSNDEIVGPFTFDGNTEKIDSIRSQARLLSLKYESFELGGFYQAGQTIIDYDPGDKVP